MTENHVFILAFLLIALNVYLAINFSMLHKKQKNKMKDLEDIFHEKNNLLQNKEHQLSVENDYQKQVSDMRETLNREIFELQKDLFEKISKK